jgi:branched-chain amino acid transport system permease protein
VIETAYRLLVNETEGTAMRVLGVAYDAKSPTAWIVILVLLAVGAWGLRRVAPRVSAAYHEASQAARAAKLAAQGHS